MSDLSLAPLAKALAAAQGELRHAEKDSANPHFKSRYASLASVLDAIRDPLSRHGLSVVQCPTRGEGGAVCVETILLHESGALLRSTLAAKPAQDTPQGIGSTITYLRRYGLMAVVGIAADDDDGEAASRPLPRREIPSALNDHAPRTTPVPVVPAELDYDGLTALLEEWMLPIDLVGQFVSSRNADWSSDAADWTDKQRGSIARRLSTAEGLATYRAWVAGGAS